MLRFIFLKTKTSWQKLENFESRLNPSFQIGIIGFPIIPFILPSVQSLFSLTHTVPKLLSKVRSETLPSLSDEWENQIRLFDSQNEKKINLWKWKVIFLLNCQTKQDVKFDEWFSHPILACQSNTDHQNILLWDFFSFCCSSSSLDLRSLQLRSIASSAATSSRW